MDAVFTHSGAFLVDDETALVVASAMESALNALDDADVFGGEHVVDVGNSFGLGRIRRAAEEVEIDDFVGRLGPGGDHAHGHDIAAAGES